MMSSNRRAQNGVGSVAPPLMLWCLYCNMHKIWFTAKRKASTSLGTLTPCLPSHQLRQVLVAKLHYGGRIYEMVKGPNLVIRVVESDFSCY